MKKRTHFWVLFIESCAMVLWVSTANGTCYFRPENKNIVFVQCFEKTLQIGHARDEKKNSFDKEFYILTISIIRMKKRTHFWVLFIESWRCPIFPGRLQPSIVGEKKLNFCVRDENRWILLSIVTKNCITSAFARITKFKFSSSIKLHNK